jgi:hypothetical protein
VGRAPAGVGSVTWVPPWRTGVAECDGCGQEVAASTLDEAGHCVSCVEDERRGRAPAAEEFEDERAEPAMQEDFGL